MIFIFLSISRSLQLYNVIDQQKREFNFLWISPPHDIKFTLKFSRVAFLLGGSTLWILNSTLEEPRQ